MRANSKIYLKGEKEPLYCAEKTATAMKKAFEDQSLPGDRVFALGTKSFRKEAIKAIYVEADGGEGHFTKSHWIILNKKEGKIWKQPYLTLEEARAELGFQEMTMQSGLKHNWVIEER